MVKNFQNFSEQGLPCNFIFNEQYGKIPRWADGPRPLPCGTQWGRFFFWFDPDVIIPLSEKISTDKTAENLTVRRKVLSAENFVRRNFVRRNFVRRNFVRLPAFFLRYTLKLRTGCEYDVQLDVNPPITINYMKIGGTRLYIYLFIFDLFIFDLFNPPITINYMKIGGTRL